MIHLPSCGSWTCFGCMCPVVALVLLGVFSAEAPFPSQRMSVLEDGLGQRPRDPLLGSNLQLFSLPHSDNSLVGAGELRSVSSSTGSPGCPQHTVEVSEWGLMSAPGCSLVWDSHC